MDYTDDFFFDEGGYPVDEEATGILEETPGTAESPHTTDDEHIPYAQ